MRHLLPFLACSLVACSAAADRSAPTDEAELGAELHTEFDAELRGASPGPAVTLAPFDEYPADSLFPGVPSPVDLGSHPAARHHEEKLRAGAADRPNFAGHLTIISWGCGTACEMHAVVDARTGHVYPQALVTGSSVAYRPGSRLLVADALHPGDEDCVTCGVTAYYEWRSDHFEPIGEGPHPHLRTLQ